MTAVFKFQDVVLINKVISDCFARERLFVWMDTVGRRWAIIKGVLWSMPPTWEESRKPICWGKLGSYEYYGSDFNPKRKIDYRWRFSTEGLTHEIEVRPPFDCRLCKHLIQIDEEKSGQEDGGIVCELRWNDGDTYVCSSTREVEWCICKDFEKDEKYIQCPNCGTLHYLFNGESTDCWLCRRKRLLE